MELIEQPVIFVVEDNLIYQNLIAKELESISQNIHFYTTGEACVSELDKQPSVIVLDYNLDGQMNGLDRWIGGVHVRSGASHWRYDERIEALTLMPHS